MALYNLIVFQVLMFEMVLFIGLIVPMPFKWRRAMFRRISESPIVARIIYAFRILTIFIAVLLFDAVTHLLKIYKEGRQSKLQGGRVDLRSETDWRARKFLSERNMYLTGFTLFLALILSRTYSLILDLIKAQEELAKVKRERSGVEGDEKLKALQADYDSLSAKYNASQGQTATTASSKKAL